MWVVAGHGPVGGASLRRAVGRGGDTELAGLLEALLYQQTVVVRRGSVTRSGGDCYF